MRITHQQHIDALLDAHNETIAHYRNLIAQRRGRNKAKKANTPTKFG
ncbi:MAG: hypothetical protein LBS09_08890 [Bacteroidales bacterium]|nr:hypothetical protein [Bacteroidales bacterium]